MPRVTVGCPVGESTVNHAALEGNLSRIDLLYAAQNALFWLPVFVLYFSETLSAGEVLLLESVYYAAVVGLEVPSGWFSDRVGRRRTLVLSGLGWGMGAATLALAGLLDGGLAMFAVGQGLLAGGRAFASGTDSSLLYETLAALDRGDELRARLARAAGIGFGTLAVASLVGGGLGAIDLRLPYLLSAVAGLVAAAAAFSCVEPPMEEPEEPGLATQWARIREASADPALRWVFVGTVLFTVLVHIPYELQQPWLKLWIGGEAAWVSGLVVAGSFAMASLGSRLAEPFARWSSPADQPPETAALTVFFRGSTLTMLVLAGVMGVMALEPRAWWVPVLVMRSIPSGLLGPLAESVVHPRVSSGVRATWLSIQSLAGRLMFSGTLVVLAWGVGDDFTLEAMRRVLLPSAVVGVLGAVGFAACSIPRRGARRK